MGKHPWSSGRSDEESSLFWCGQERAIWLGGTLSGMWAAWKGSVTSWEPRAPCPSSPWDKATFLPLQVWHGSCCSDFLTSQAETGNEEDGRWQEDIQCTGVEEGPENAHSQQESAKFWLWIITKLLLTSVFSNPSVFQVGADTFFPVYNSSIAH